MQLCGRTILSRLSVDDDLPRDCFQDGSDCRKRNGGLHVPKVWGVDDGDQKRMNGCTTEREVCDDPFAIVHLSRRRGWGNDEFRLKWLCDNINRPE